LQRLLHPKLAAKKIACLLFVSAQPFRVSVEQFHEARLVEITYRGLAIRLDPVGMLDAQVVVNLLPKLGVGVDFVKHRLRLGQRCNCAARRLVELTALVSALFSETNEFHKWSFI